MDFNYINIIPPSQGVGYLMPNTMTNIGNEEKLLESVLKDKIGGIRMQNSHLGTQWDQHLSYLLSMALVNYEMERIGGQSFAAEEF